MKNSKTALICGVSGQDGAYLSQLLLQKGYRVVGTSRDAQVASFSRLQRLGIENEIETVSMSLIDFRSVLQVISNVAPDEIYNLAGQTSVGLSFEQPVETFESISTGTLNLLEAIRFTGKAIRLYNAGSSECFGETPKGGGIESTPFQPRSPYAIAKSSAFWLVANYREAYNLDVCSGILFNHESPLRPSRFVTQKIVSSACRIAKGSSEKLILGRLDVERDWGWAPEYVEAMWLMLQKATCSDFVIATGQSSSLLDFARTVFSTLDLSLEDHLVTQPSLFRPSDIGHSRGNPSLAYKQLGWRAKFKMPDVAARMVEVQFETS